MSANPDGEAGARNPRGDRRRTSFAAETLPDSVTHVLSDGYHSVIHPDYSHWLLEVIKAERPEIDRPKAGTEEPKATAPPKRKLEAEGRKPVQSAAS